MITDNTYYINELYIPHAKPSITSDVTTVSAELNDFIDEYERECLIKSLGLELALVFIDQLDITQTNGLKAGSDAKWNDLLNGKQYTNPKGEVVEWRGIRRKIKASDTVPRFSFLACYVYCMYEQNSDFFRGGVGNLKLQAKNAVEVSASPKVTNAWRKMVNIIQGKEFKRDVFATPYGWGVDYYYNNSEVTMYQFIRDINNDTPDTYPNFKPTYWNVFRNQFGI